MSDHRDPPLFRPSLTTGAPSPEPPAGVTDPRVFAPEISQGAAEVPPRMEDAQPPPGAPQPPRSRAGRVLAIGLSGLLLVWLVDWLWALSAQIPVLGAVGWAAFAVFVLGAGGLAWREWRALQLLDGAEALRRRIAAAATAEAATHLLAPLGRDLLSRGVAAPRLLEGWNRAIPGARTAPEVVRAFEAGPLSAADARAEAAVRRAAVTAGGFVALSGNPVADMIGFALRTIMLMREVMVIYGLRPGRVAELRLLRRLLVEGAVVGAADLAGDAVASAAGQVTGMVAGSAAQGALAAYRVARIGTLVMAGCRPVPFSPGKAPTVARILARGGAPPK
ncbi:DUF697 domain-containing protein [Sabulicella glaciei]|uniref:DUF697 domain-containing protein n=1 Tax=Sabulicella glaciei TaxID=2984948 RepID=A0ABT3NPV4_9PROT|nr:DUF697 domain-containing protein [Roseococcus sp. MDT2-1-1]MCW8084198.1 DUF697 domain-containing protein [Roseococcus sp. MDT2-1-1]